MRLFIIVAATLAAIPAAAQTTPTGRALVIGNANYADAADLDTGPQIAAAAETLRRAGFTVETGADLTTQAMRSHLAEFLAGDEPGRRVILLSGHFAHSARASWFLGTEAAAPDLAGVDGAGLALDTVLEIAGAAPGQALVLLATEEARLPLGAGLAAGVGPLDIPQGVSVAWGTAEAAGGMLTALAEGQPISASLTAGGVQGAGYLPALPFVAPATGVAPAPAAPAPAPTAPTDPAAAAEAAERALGLTTDQRRQVQRDLTMLGHDTRGVDGVLGAGSRRALADWQRAAGLPATGFLTADQLSRLRDQGALRAAERAREDRERQAREEEADRAFWDATGRAGDEPGLRAYLDRYPKGAFANVARERLQVFETAADKADWDRAEAANTADAYRAYLAARPQGSHADLARQRLAALTGPTEAERTAAEGEAALGLNGVTRNMIESRLDALGMRPGAVDGSFDADTRAAIRRYQDSRGMPVTGYVTAGLMQRLLAEAVQGILR